MSCKANRRYSLLRCGVLAVIAIEAVWYARTLRRLMRDGVFVFNGVAVFGFAAGIVLSLLFAFLAARKLKSSATVESDDGSANREGDD